MLQQQPFNLASLNFSAKSNWILSSSPIGSILDAVLRAVLLERSFLIQLHVVHRASNRVGVLDVDDLALMNDLMDIAQSHADAEPPH